jgi:tetratricopeptide (TPR) repeat protein
MRPRLAKVWLLPLALLLAGAAPEQTPEELVRLGNAAFEREEYAVAVDLYARAEEHITNPGLVAHNKAAALYRLSRYDEAARSYESCLEEATGLRRAALLYDLGNCRLHQSEGTRAERLQHAVECFSQCLRQEGIDQSLREDARHNLEVAKLMLIQARAGGSNNEGGNQEEPKDDPKTKEEKKDPDLKVGMGDPDTDPKKDPKVGLTPEPDPTGKQTPIPVKDPPPGKGNLPPIPDRAEKVPMTPEDAAEHLRLASERILYDRRKHQQQSAPVPSRRIRDY